MFCDFEIFTSCQGSIRTFSKHYSKCKAVSTKFRKTLQERRLPIIKLSQDNSQNNYLNFLTSKNIFITLQYSGNILSIFLKQTIVECSSSILEALLRDIWNWPKDQHLLLSNHTCLTQKQLFHEEFFKNSFPLKFPLNVSLMSRTACRLGRIHLIMPIKMASFRLHLRVPFRLHRNIELQQ